MPVRLTNRERHEHRCANEARSWLRLRLRRPRFIGGILVGAGLGILLDDFFAWFVIGIGAGFILMGFIAALGK